MYIASVFCVLKRLKPTGAKNMPALHSAGTPTNFYSYEKNAAKVRQIFEIYKFCA